MSGRSRLLAGGFCCSLVAYHVPVMVREVLELIPHRPDGVYCDGTTGTGGHALEILRRLGPEGRLVCVDQDPVALTVARERLEEHGGRIAFHRGSFSELTEVIEREGLEGFDGILLDLGLNSYTLSRPEAGLSYQHDVDLDMAVDPDVPQNAAEYIANVSETEFADDLYNYGDIRRSRAYARRVVQFREHQPIRTTGDLVRALAGSRFGSVSPGELSRIFQAIRVVVLQEMERLELLLERVPGWLRPGGRLLIMSYASHEDRRCKRVMHSEEGPGAYFDAMTKKPIVASREEVVSNRRARSAKLRAFQKRGE